MWSPGAAPERGPRSSWAERWRESRSAWPFVVVVLVVFGCLYTGVITATEAGGIGAFVTLVVWVLGSRLMPKEMAPLTGRAFGLALDRTLRDHRPLRARQAPTAVTWGFAYSRSSNR